MLLFSDNDDQPYTPETEREKSYTNEQDVNEYNRLKKEVEYLEKQYEMCKAQVLSSQQLTEINDSLDKKIADIQSPESTMRRNELADALKETEKVTGITILEAETFNENIDIELEQDAVLLSKVPLDKERARNSKVITTMRCKTIGGFEFNVAYKSYKGEIKQIDLKLSLSLQLVLKNEIVEKLVDALALPQIFQCVRSCGASLVARASTWSRILKKNPDAVVMTPASLLHCQVLHLALPSTDRALFGLRVEWDIIPEETGKVQNFIAFECVPYQETPAAIQLASDAEDLLRAKYTDGTRVENAIDSVIREIEKYM